MSLGPGPAGSKSSRVSPHKLPDLDTQNPHQGGVSPTKWNILVRIKHWTPSRLSLTCITPESPAPLCVFLDILMRIEHQPGFPTPLNLYNIKVSCTDCAVPVSFMPPVSSVTSPLCPLPPQTSATLLTNTQATSHEIPWIHHRTRVPRLAHIEEVDDEDAFIFPADPEPVSYATIQHVDDLDPIADLEPPVQPVP